MNDVAPTTNVAPMKFGMGANIRRKEDKALVRSSPGDTGFETLHRVIKSFREQ